MKKRYSIILLSLIPLVFNACGGGSGGGNNTTNNNSSEGSSSSGLDYKTSVTLASYLNDGSPYTVCADFNENYSCDKDELSAKLINNTHTFTSSNPKLQNALILAKKETKTQAAVNKNKSNNIYLSTLAAGESATATISIKSTLESILYVGGKNITKSKNIIEKSYNSLGIKDTNEIYRKNILKLFEQEDLLSINSILSDGLPSNIANDSFDISAINKRKIHKLTINDTGLKKYFDGTNLSLNPSSDFPAQDASYGLDKTDNGFKFEKLDKNGDVVNNSSKDYSCLRDKRTNNIWEIKSSDKDSPRYKFSTFAIDNIYGVTLKSSKEAKCNKTAGLSSCKTSAYVKYLNSIKYCGKNDWELPSFFDYFNIFDFSIEKTIEAPQYYIEKDSIDKYKDLKKPNVTTLYYALNENYFNDIYEKIEDFIYDTREKLPGIKFPTYDSMYYWTSSYNPTFHQIFLVTPIGSNGFNSQVDDGTEAFHLRLVSKGEK